ncbi:MAG: class I SAM-dependent methyltransferase [Hyphomicrobium sp.]
MPMDPTKNAKLLAAARTLAQDIARHLDIDASVRLWDGSLVPLGREVSGDLKLTIASPGTIASILRWPTLDRMIQHYAHGNIGLEGGTLIDLGRQVSDPAVRRRLKGVKKAGLARHLLPFLVAPADRPGQSRDFSGDASGTDRHRGQNQDFIRFHYDVGNDFYRLFLDPEMLYSCAYFTDWDNSLDQAQHDKLDMICRKLRLKQGERFLDIGCGWGALICHAARTYGVKAHGITLSQEQLAFARTRITEQGLASQVTVELIDYQDLKGEWDKIASIGMYEHIGLANIPAYMVQVRGLLADGGLFLNHAIARRAKRRQRAFSARAEQKALQKYIFPGGELDDIGHTVSVMEQTGFEVHDVEAWRWHYAHTTRLWCEKLDRNRAKAEAIVGAPTTRIWLAYLAGCSLAFERGSARIFQTLASKLARGQPPLPPTRADLYGVRDSGTGV